MSDQEAPAELISRRNWSDTMEEQIMKSDLHSVPFRVEIDQAAVDDLKYRLIHSRLVDSSDNPGWRDGTDPRYLRELLSYWLEKYDWRRAEAEINAFPQFKVTLDGTAIHYIHLPSKNPRAKALILTHGWPDSFYRYIRVLPLLTDHYHLIVPSLPGFGFSGGMAKTNQATAELWLRLVTEVLGYPDFYAAGSDIGSGVTLELARQHQDKVRAVYLTDVGWDGLQADQSTLSAIEKAFLATANAWFMAEGAYIMLHSTKPLTAAQGLNDSPAGLAAWAASFSNNGQPETVVDQAFGGRDAFLTNLCIYWFSQTAASAMSAYKRNAEATWGKNAGQSKSDTSANRVLTAPVALSLYPRDIVVPREWAERQGLNIRRYTVMPEGGHFPALELPELFASDLHQAFTEIGNA